MERIQNAIRHSQQARKQPWTPVNTLFEKKGTRRFLIDNFLMKPKIDFAFKEIMEDDKARVRFLSVVLGLDPENIKETRILD